MYRGQEFFDPMRQSFNPLKEITYRKAREIADILYAVSPEGENALTVRNGERAADRTLGLRLVHPALWTIWWPVAG
jgi:hypothetical protein